MRRNVFFKRPWCFIMLKFTVDAHSALHRSLALVTCYTSLSDSLVLESSASDAIDVSASCNQRQRNNEWGIIWILHQRFIEPMLPFACNLPLLADSGTYLMKENGGYTLRVCNDFADTLFKSCSGISRECSSYLHSSLYNYALSELLNVVLAG